MRATWMWLGWAAAVLTGSATLHGCAGQEFESSGAGAGAPASTSSSTGEGGGGGEGGGMGGAGGNASRCGNGVINFADGEQCDDGNAQPGDGCSDTCRIEPPVTCGDGDLDYVNGEQCDDANGADGDGCSAACLIEPATSCGNGVLDLAADEQCDDGNTIGGDGCGPACHYEKVGQTCGDDVKEPGEACDDGNLVNGDDCNATCNFTNVVTTFAGTQGAADLADGVGAAARFVGEGSLAANATHLFLGQSWGGPVPLAAHVVRSIEVATATVETVAGGAPGNTDAAIGTNARFGSIGAITSDGATIWIADEGNLTIRAMDAAPPHAVTTVAGGAVGYQDGIGAQAGLTGVRGLAYFGGYVYFVDPVAATLRRLDPATQEVITLAGTPGVVGLADGTGPAVKFQSPRYVASDGSGMLYIADTNGYTIRSYNTVTDHVGTFAGNGAQGYVDGIGAAARLHRPRGVTSDGTSLYWVEYNAHTVRQSVLATQEVSTLAGTPEPGGAGSYLDGVGNAALFSFPWSLTFHYASRSLFVYDTANSVIRRIQ